MSLPGTGLEPGMDNVAEKQTGRLISRHGRSTLEEPGRPPGTDVPQPASAWAAWAIDRRRADPQLSGRSANEVEVEAS